jgi:3-hydroxymyristoyl/3-hydroxydecanoyl-(acyl carrier protein) dehydratase
MMAQAAGIILLMAEAHKGKLAYLAGIDKARFRKPVLPGDTVVLEAQLLRARSTMGWMKTTAKVGENIVCEAELAFAVVARDNGVG